MSFSSAGRGVCRLGNRRSCTLRSIRCSISSKRLRSTFSRMATSARRPCTFDQRADRNLSGDGIGDVILESGGLGFGAPQNAFADVEQRGVFGEADVVRERQCRAIVLQKRCGVAVHHRREAGAVAGLHDCRIPRRLGGAERDRQRGGEEKCGFHGSGTMVTRRMVRVNIKGWALKSRRRNVDEGL